MFLWVFSQNLAYFMPKLQKIERAMSLPNILLELKEKPLIDFFGEEEGARIWSRFEVHHTPKHASWLNQAEIAIGMYSRQCLGNRRIGDIQDLRKKTNAWAKAINLKKIIIN